MTLRLALAAALACALAAPALSQISPLTAPQKANVQKVIDNLNGLVAAGRAGIGPRDPKAEQKRKQLDRLAEISANLAKKLTGGNIHSVRGLKDGKPPVFVHDDEKPSTARAAYCDDKTKVRNGEGWDNCPEGDILVDPAIIDPGNGTAIDETNLEGWKQKWTLVHVLAHEKMHEIMINEEVKALVATPGWKFKTPGQKEELTGKAKEDGATAGKHQEVYEWQKTVLRWERKVLEGRLEELKKAKPQDEDAIKTVKDKIEWLKKEVDKLEADMNRATGGREFAAVLNCVPSAPAVGFVHGVIVAPGLSWTLEAARLGGVTRLVTTVATDWLGEVVEEAPAHSPAMTLVLSENIFSAGAVQPDLCAFVRQAIAVDQIRVIAGPVGASRGAAAAPAPSAADLRGAAERNRPSQSWIAQPTPTEPESPYVALPAVGGQTTTATPPDQQPQPSPVSPQQVPLPPQQGPVPPQLPGQPQPGPQPQQGNPYGYPPPYCQPGQPPGAYCQPPPQPAPGP